MQYWIIVNVHWIPTFELPSSCHKRHGLYLLTYFIAAKMIRNWKTWLTLEFAGKFTFAFSALALGLWPWLWVCGLGLGLACLWAWPWPWLTGLGTSGLVNIPAMMSAHVTNCHKLVTENGFSDPDFLWHANISPVNQRLRALWAN